MDRSVILKKGIRDILIGFFSWVIISNLVFLLFLNSAFFVEGNESSMQLIAKIIWLPTIGAIIVLLVKKTVGISAGIIIAVIGNVTLWILVLFSRGLMESLTLGEIIVWISIPLPIGLFFVMMS